MGRVLITGAGSGIGAGIARVLAGRDWEVATNDIDPDAAAQITDEIGGAAVPGDIGDSPGQIVGTAAAAMGGLDALVNNAGIHRRSTLRTATPDQLDDVYRVNLRAVVLASQAALEHLSAGGAIVNISSIAAVTPQMDVWSLFGRQGRGLRVHRASGCRVGT